MNFVSTPVSILASFLGFISAFWEWFINASLRSEAKRLRRFARWSWKYINNFLVRVERRMAYLFSVLTAWLLVLNNTLYSAIIRTSEFIMTFRIVNPKKGRPQPSPYNVGESYLFKDEKSRKRRGVIKVIDPKRERGTYLIETKQGQQFTVTEENIRETEAKEAAAKEAKALSKGAKAKAKAKKATESEKTS